MGIRASELELSELINHNHNYHYSIMIFCKLR